MSVTDSISIGNIIALYGALLSTVLAYLHWRRNRGRFAVNPDVLQVSTMNRDEVTYRMIEVVNIGIRHLYLDDFGFCINNDTIVSTRSSHDEYPMRLEEGQRHRSIAVSAEYNHEVIEYLWARDTTGKEYRSNRYPFSDS